MNRTFNISSIKRIYLREVLLLLFICILSTSGLTQHKSLILNHFRTLELEKSVSNIDSIRHTGIKPFLENEWDLTKVYGYAKDSSKYYYNFQVVAMRKHMVEIHEKDFYAGIDIVFDWRLGLDLADTSDFRDTSKVFTNTRGIYVEADIGDYVSFQTMIFENQGDFPNYLKQYANSTGVVPGQGRHKAFKHGAYDYSASYGWLSVQALKHINLQIGTGKHFVGHGYRSVLLSDFAYNYPYLRASTTLMNGRLKYSWMYSSLQSLERMPRRDVPESLFKRKAGNFYYLSYIPHPRVELGLFESIIWQTWNETEGTLPLNYKTFIPIIGVNSGLLGFDSEHNAMLGLNLKFKVTDNIQVYGQLAMDDLASNKTAWQGGAKFYNLLLENLNLQFEYDYASRYFGSSDFSNQNYVHMNESMAHPLGSSFEEMIGILNYRYKRWFLQTKFHLIHHETTPGGSIFTIPSDDELMEYEEFINEIAILDVQCGVFINPKNNMNFSLGWMYRTESLSLVEHKTNWIYFAFRTSLFNKYYDF